MHGKNWERVAREGRTVGWLLSRRTRAKRWAETGLEEQESLGSISAISYKLRNSNRVAGENTMGPESHIPTLHQ